LQAIQTAQGLDIQLADALFANAEATVANMKLAEMKDHHQEQSQLHYNRAVTAEELAKNLSTQIVTLKIQVGASWMGKHP